MSVTCFLNKNRQTSPIGGYNSFKRDHILNDKQKTKTQQIVLVLLYSTFSK
jgi:hypothetical protein